MLALGDTEHNRGELYTFATGEWAASAPYPYREQIGWVSLVELGGDFYSFGGVDKYGGDPYGTPVNIIARFSPSANRWTQLGQLNVQREAAAVAVINNEFFVIGGSPQRPHDWDQLVPTEKCTLDTDNTIVCNNISNVQAFFSPAAFVVPDDFC